MDRGKITTVGISGNGEIYIGGGILAPGLLRMARWNGIQWVGLAGGVSDPVHTIVPANDGGVFIGGSFGYVYDEQDTPMDSDHIARWSADKIFTHGFE